VKHHDETDRAGALKFIFPGNVTLDGTNVIAATQNSPMFLSADLPGWFSRPRVTQFGRCAPAGGVLEPARFSPNYHVLLGAPSIAPTITITVQREKGNAIPEWRRLLRSVGYQLFRSGSGWSGTELHGKSTARFRDRQCILGTNGIIQNCCIWDFTLLKVRPPPRRRPGFMRLI